jgi:TrmH family RNA methyltransferase
MTAASDKPSSGDFDLSGFKSKPRKKAADEGAASAPKKPASPRAYGESDGPKRTGKLPSTFKSRERDARPDRPREARKPFEAGDAPRKKFASDFRPKEGDRKPFGAGGSKPAWKSSDAPRKPYGDRGGAGGAGGKPAYKPYGADRSADRPSRSYGASDGARKPYGADRNERPARPYGAGGDRPAWKSDGPRKPYGSSDAPRKPYGSSDAPRKPYGSSDAPRKPYGSSDAPRKPYGAGGDKPAWKSDAPRKPYGTERGAGGPGGGYTGSKDSTRTFESELSPEVKKFLPLLTEKGRHKESRFLLEGAKNISDVAEHSPEILHTVLVAEGFEDTVLKARLDELRIRTRVVKGTEVSALCGTEAPQGIVAVANFGSLRPDWTTIQSVTLLDGVQDPGNLGAILRTSAALGMDAVVLGKGTCDPYNPKVVRASAATLLRMPLETGEDLSTKIHFLRTKGFTIVATSPHAKITLDKATLRKKVALLFGNEGGGVGGNLIDQADQVVRIPMKGKVESLNVAVAHGLLAYELMRLKK